MSIRKYARLIKINLRIKRLNNHLIVTENIRAWTKKRIENLKIGKYIHIVKKKKIRIPWKLRFFTKKFTSIKHNLY